MTGIRRFLVTAGFTVLCGTAYGSTPCAGLIVQDVVMPGYPPIARAAHIEGVVSFPISIDSNRQAHLGTPTGSKFLAGSAETFFAARQYSLEGNTPSLPCEYTAEVEYRIVPGESDDFNSFARVTRLGAGHTLVESQGIKPRCQDCLDVRCSLDHALESPPPNYPPIAVAAHIEGDVIAVIRFDPSGKVRTVDHMLGPPILQAAATEYLRAWVAGPPTDNGGCEANIFLSYHLTSASQRVGPTTATKADATHILIETNAVMTYDPIGDPIERHRKKFLGLF